ncbi:hypothetical protein HN371_02935 [Candidatus Poribacteria bacterium]|jgi:HEAT repeat protein/outer membrane protein assembly factor BamB|nr:hypothetical protein [Candidatus Poribacteria bacterium]MBT5531702.1 hypothetical protein [Candidatus Poribacteria bacterium]MBT5710454.1 hypothetical protein [Candidatus Poribacteria bacterium]MBT7100601.1 hypothetical protein [Candidatus Poribacteria bacterium]MBT7809182.1 hypothetical protein [Candidatus Poribacteria bacterium]
MLYHRYAASRVTPIAALLVVLAFASPGCGDPGPPAPPTPVELAERFTAPDVQTRREAGRALASLRRRAAPATAALAAVLDDADPDTRAYASLALGAVGAEALPAITQTLATGSSAAQQGALAALVAMKAPPTEAVPAVLSLLAGEDPNVRRHAILFLAVLGDRAAGALIEALPTSGGVETVAIAESLRMISAIAADALATMPEGGGAGAFPAVTAAFDGAPAEGRAHLAALGSVLGASDEEASAWLAAALKDDDARVRQAAAESSARLGEARADVVNALSETVASDPSPFVRHAAAYALGNSGTQSPDAIDALIQALADMDARVRLRASHALRSLKVSRGVTAGEAYTAAVGFPPDEASSDAPDMFPVEWEATGSLSAFSSPRLADLNGGGVLDIVIGLGAERLSGEYILYGEDRFAALHEGIGYVVARDGATGAELWHADARDELFGSPLFTHIDDDGVPDVVIGGRRLALHAFSGATGTELWVYEPVGEAVQYGRLNFYTPMEIPDRNGDGRPDILVTHGGDSSRPPFTPRPAGRLMVLNSVNGAVLGSAAMPDSAECYVSAYAYGPSRQLALFGSGGETHSGSLWTVPVTDILAGDLSRATELLSPMTFKGMVAPPALADLTADGTPDIVAAAFDGRLAVVDGSTHDVVWSRFVAAAETWASPAIGYFNDDDIPDVFASFSTGMWPQYVASYHAAFDGRNGDILWEQTEPHPYMASPVAVDVDADGRDEVIVLTADAWYHTSDIVVVDVADGSVRRTSGLRGRAVSTPVIADMDGDGTLEMVTAMWLGPLAGSTWTIQRRSLGIADAGRIAWGAYLGTNYDGVFVGR